MKILLVGGCGFIGHNLSLNLRQKKHEVFILDSLSVNNILSFTDSEIKNKKLYNSILNNRIDLIKENQIKLIIKDARNNNVINKICNAIKPDIIVHLAAVSHANKSNKDPHNTFDNSLRTLENTLDFAKNSETHVIFISSSMVYGNFEKGEVDENSKCDPIGIYGTLKYAGELMVKSYNQVFGIPYTIIRPSALYGERCVSRRVGQIFIENAIQNLEIIVNGNGEEKLDFTYIQDLVNGISICCENKNSINQTFNFTYGNARKINELIQILKTEFSKVKIKYIEKEAFMPKRGTLNNNKAKLMLNFEPEFPIEIGYPKYIRWYKNFWQNLK